MKGNNGDLSASPYEIFLNDSKEQNSEQSI